MLAKTDRGGQVCELSTSLLPSMSMIHLVILAVHLLSTIAKLVRPGGVRTVVAESLVLKQQLLISSRSRRRAPNLNSFDRFVLGLGSLFVTPSRIPKLAVILKPRTLLRFHEALKKRKYRWLFSSGGHRRPGPKGPSKELIDAIVGTVRRECLDRMLIFCEAHLRQTLSSYAAYYNEVRTHLPLGKNAPPGRAGQPTRVVVAIPILSGLHHHYVRI